jgi:hypothetical protein
MSTQQLLIGGEWTQARSGREYERHFPYGGRAGLEEFTELRSITVQEGPGQYPI